ncbi:MAG: DUF3006 domain-containing protein [Bacillota bacterium]
MTETRALIERFEAGQVRLRVGPEQTLVEWPASCLPDGVREGDFVRVAVTFDPVTTEQARRRLAGLITRLSGSAHGGSE